MIGLVFQFFSEYIDIRINGNSLLFRTSQTGSMFSPVEGLKFDKVGVIKEFPDLKDNKDWKIEAIKRFKEKIKNMKSEEEVSNYLIKDLTKFGYIPIAKQKQGFRVQKLN